MGQIKASNIPELLRNIEYDASNLMKERVVLEGLAIYSQWDELWSEDIKKTILLEDMHNFILTPQDYLPREGKLCYLYMRVFPTGKRGELKHSELRKRENLINIRVRIPNFSYEFLSPSLPSGIQRKILIMASEQLQELSERIGRSLPLGVKI